MKYREFMKDEGGNLSWCKPMLLMKNDKTLIIEINEGKLVGEVTLKDIANTFDVPQLDRIGDLWNYSDYNEIQSDELDCRDCPSFSVCEAMDEEVE